MEYVIWIERAKKTKIIYSIFKLHTVAWLIKQTSLSLFYSDSPQAQELKTRKMKLTSEYIKVHIFELQRMI